MDQICSLVRSFLGRPPWFPATPSRLSAFCILNSLFVRARANAAGFRPQLSRSLAPKVGVRTTYGDEAGIGGRGRITAGISRSGGDATWRKFIKRDLLNHLTNMSSMSEPREMKVLDSSQRHFQQTNAEGGGDAGGGGDAEAPGSGVKEVQSDGGGTEVKVAAGRARGFVGGLVLLTVASVSPRLESPWNQGFIRAQTCSKRETRPGQHGGC